MPYERPRSCADCLGIPPGSNDRSPLALDERYTRENRYVFCEKHDAMILVDSEGRPTTPRPRSIDPSELLVKAGHTLMAAGR